MKLYVYVVAAIKDDNGAKIIDSGKLANQDASSHQQRIGDNYSDGRARRGVVKIRAPHIHAQQTDDYS